MTTEEWNNIPEFNMDDEWERKMGEYFGYPQCCIEWFVNRLEYLFDEEGKLTDNQEQVNNSGGFIPCPSCADRIVRDGLRIEELITNRICATSYPEEDNHEIRLAWMSKFLPEGVAELSEQLADSLDMNEWILEKEDDIIEIEELNEEDAKRFVISYGEFLMDNGWICVGYDIYRIQGLCIDILQSGNTIKIAKYAN